MCRLCQEIPLDRTVELRPLEPSPVNALARELMVKTRRYRPFSLHMVKAMPISVWGVRMSAGVVSIRAWALAS